MFKAAIFDMDGLLIDSERAIMCAWMNAANEHGIALTQADYVVTVGLSIRDAHVIMLERLGSKPVFDVVRARVLELLAPQAPEPRFPLKHGARHVLNALRGAGVRCAVASSSAVLEIRHRLAEVNVIEHFEAFAGGDEVARGKPDPAVYRLVLQRLGVDAVDGLAFEDSENGARAAIAAGLKVVIVPDLRQPPEDLIERSLDVLPDLHSALDRLRQWFPDGLWR